MMKMKRRKKNVILYSARTERMGHELILSIYYS